MRFLVHLNDQQSGRPYGLDIIDAETTKDAAQIYARKHVTLNQLTCFALGDGELMGIAVDARRIR